ncbi:hypothetical protein OZX69_03795 [Lactobacillus sp. ESL0731]|uniref:hypothetical protein n=1 Tax=unclassified Lactobacillus TaxID=2620435 RepID=UPI0023F6E31D|nr:MULTISPECIES: hypothetical protein [unclassified Lactobacillus]WEV51832.1 hypothetical protein OZX63_03790 [Lactobacillus sp. ESL0700]WEV62962.1 hypothetical protein OZX69_03795 [Lactobacillus sp. ESL0731]
MKKLRSLIFVFLISLGIVAFNNQKVAATVRHDDQYYLKKAKLNKDELVGKYLIDNNGRRHKLTLSKKGNHTKAARKVAKVIAKVCQEQGGTTDLQKVDMAAYYVSLFCARDHYTMQGPYFTTAYGVFIAKQYSCAGSAAALGMVLKQMGYKYHHVNKNKYTHQWCTLKMDGKKGYADGQAGIANYGKYFTKKRQVIKMPANTLKSQLLQEALQKYSETLN